MRRHGPVSLFNPDGRSEDPPPEIELPDVGVSYLSPPREIAVDESALYNLPMPGHDGENNESLEESLSKKSRGELLLLFLSALDRNLPPEDRNTLSTLTTAAEQESLLPPPVAQESAPPQVDDRSETFHDEYGDDPYSMEQGVSLNDSSMDREPDRSSRRRSSVTLEQDRSARRRGSDGNNAKAVRRLSHVSFVKPNKLNEFMDEPTKSQNPAPAQSSSLNELSQHSAVVRLMMQEPIEDDEYAELDTTTFSESSYTLIYMCDKLAVGFWYGLFVYMLQVTTIALTLVDIIDPKDGNVFRIPPMVTLPVSIAQGVALFLALAYQQDMIEAVLKLQDGFCIEVLEHHPGATFDTWMFSCLAQLFSGFLLLFTIFVLTIQVDSVLNIMLNFAALHFMSEIDDLGFALAKMGFATDKLQQVALEVADFKVPHKQRSNSCKRMLYYLAMVWIFIWFIFYKHRQLSGYYLQSYIYVQFGDSYNPKIPYYSGLLSSDQGWKTTYRQYRDVGTKKILLSYCEDEHAWTFSEKDDPCDFFAKSTRTSTFDVTTIPSSDWKVLDSLSRLQPFDSFNLVGRDCQPNICQGECIDGLCHCPPDRFGLDCEFDNICPELVLHGESKPFPTATLRQYPISDQFQLLRNATGHNIRVYNMPVYYSTQTYRANIIFFGGRRWVLTSELGLFNDTEELLKEDPETRFFPHRTADLLNEYFHAHFEAKHTTFFLSDAVDFETPDYLPTPSGVGWWTVKVIDEDARIYEPDRPVDASLTCSDCRVDHGGSCDSSGGVCNVTTGICECKEGFHGHKCELQQECYEMDRPCHGDGVCDIVSGDCRCNLPFYGKLCDFPFFCFEEYGACRNGGVCNYTTGFCDCPDDPAVTGWGCEKRKDCKVYGCENGGLCDDDTGVCYCPEPYQGYLCSLINETQRTELCSSDYTIQQGSLCSDNYNCATSGCRNGGICMNATGLCDCSEPYTGADCSEVPDCTSDDDCIGGGWCMTWSGSCNCNDGYASGKLCENKTISACTSDTCLNGGVCGASGWCECSLPYTGARCEYILAEEAI